MAPPSARTIGTGNCRGGPRARGRPTENSRIPHLAKVMGVSPSSLYNHVSSKDDIIEMMRGQAMGEIELPDPDTDWVQALRQIAKGYMRSYSRAPAAHPAADGTHRP